jgi:hypothetical protein
VPNEKFEIGVKEKHFFTVEYNAVTKRIKIEQDGKTVANTMNWSPLAKKFKFDIGGSEQHQIEISVGPFHPIELKVDGQRIKPLL